jgi:hypothetical protein
LYSGIVPSLLPAFSAPIAVSVVPSFLASSAETRGNAAAGMGSEQRGDQCYFGFHE